MLISPKLAAAINEQIGHELGARGLLQLGKDGGVDHGRIHGQDPLLGCAWCSACTS